MTAERRSALILAGIVLVEGAWVVLNAWHQPDGVGCCCCRSRCLRRVRCTLPSVRATMLRPSWLKLLGIAVAVAAGILEEVVFRKLLMDWLASNAYGTVVQVLASALAFGAAHGVWGLFGRSMKAAGGATVATGALGLGLAVVYIVSGRSLAPCVAAQRAHRARLGACRHTRGNGPTLTRCSTHLQRTGDAARLTVSAKRSGEPGCSARFLTLVVVCRAG
jgi:membrane protease YdiL (CAAX protease family)